MQRPVVKKLWFAGRASEDEEELMEEVRSHCERCHDDKNEKLEVQAERIREQRCSSDIMVARQRRKVHITVDSMVTEMLQNLPVESVCEITHSFEEMLKGESRVPDAWRVLRLVF